MPAKRRLTMRQLRQMLRLAGSGTSSREIAVVLGISRSTVQDNLQRAAAVGLSWPLPGELTDDALENKLFDSQQRQTGHEKTDRTKLGRSCRRAQEARCHLAHPLGGVSWVASRRIWLQSLLRTLSQFRAAAFANYAPEQAAGDKVFVDYSGKNIPIVDRKTGEIREAEIFVAVLGASSFTYAEATWTQTLPDWIGSHVRMFRFFGGVPRLVVCD